MDLNNEELVSIVKLLCKENKELKKQLEISNRTIQELKLEKEALEKKSKFKELINAYQLEDKSKKVLALDKGSRSDKEDIERLKRIIKENVSSTSYSTWLLDALNKSYIENDFLVLPCNTGFIADIIEERYEKMIKEELKNIKPNSKGVKIIVPTEDGDSKAVSKKCQDIINKLDDVIKGNIEFSDNENWLKEGLNKSYLNSNELVIPCKNSYEAETIKDRYKELIEAQLKIMGLDVNEIRTIVSE